MKKINLNEAVFNDINKDSAYWIGFLMADGCVYKNSLSISLKIDDYTHLKNFRLFIESTNSITINNRKPLYVGGPSYQSCQFSVSSKYMVEQLAKYGLVSNKSLSAEVSEDLLYNSNFWLGVMDGDGSIYIDRRRKGIAALKLSLCGSAPLMYQFKLYCSSLVPTKSSVNSGGKDTLYQFALSGKFALTIINTLYSNRGNFMLERKYENMRKTFEHCEININDI